MDGWNMGIEVVGLVASALFAWFGVLRFPPIEATEDVFYTRGPSNSVVLFEDVEHFLSCTKVLDLIKRPFRSSVTCGFSHDGEGQFAIKTEKAKQTNGADYQLTPGFVTLHFCRMNINIPKYGKTVQKCFEDGDMNNLQIPKEGERSKYGDSEVVQIMMQHTKTGERRGFVDNEFTEPQYVYKATSISDLPLNDDDWDLLNILMYQREKNVFHFSKSLEKNMKLSFSFCSNFSLITPATTSPPSADLNYALPSQYSKQLVPFENRWKNPQAFFRATVRLPSGADTPQLCNPTSKTPTIEPGEVLIYAGSRTQIRSEAEYSFRNLLNKCGLATLPSSIESPVESTFVGQRVMQLILADGSENPARRRFLVDELADWGRQNVGRYIPIKVCHAPKRGSHRLESMLLYHEGVWTFFRSYGKNITLFSFRIPPPSIEKIPEQHPLQSERAPDWSGLDLLAETACGVTSGYGAGTPVLYSITDAQSRRPEARNEKGRLPSTFVGKIPSSGRHAFDVRMTAPYSCDRAARARTTASQHVENRALVASSRSISFGDQSNLPELLKTQWHEIFTITNSPKFRTNHSSTPPF